MTTCSSQKGSIVTVHIRQVNPAGMRVFFGTITSGESIHQAMVTVATTHNITTATFKLLGGLQSIEFTAYDFVKQTRHEPMVIETAMEIVGGHGTISLLEGAIHTHMHLVVSYRDEQSPTGVHIVGGHVAKANAFAVEFSLMAYDGVPVERGFNPETGLQLWDLPLLHSG